jgi:HSP20 family protein
MTKKEKPRRFDDWDELFGEFDAEFDEMRTRMDKILEQFLQGDPAQQQNPLVYGFSMRVGPDKVPVIQEFGNTVGTVEEGGKPELLREPLTDIIEEQDKVRIIVELPGVEKQDIRLHALERSLEIDVDNPRKRFNKRLDLPCDILPDSAKASYKNGVLEIVLTRQMPKEKGRAIPIE